MYYRFPENCEIRRLCFELIKYELLIYYLKYELLLFLLKNKIKL